LLSAEAAGGDWEVAIPAAAAVELLHNFSLIHDDIQDQSTLRRGRPTVWAKWGVAQAINAGDVMFTQAFYALRKLADSVSPAVGLEAQTVLQDTCLRLTEGQYLDMAYETKRELPMQAYWPMITGKTAALLGCCAELGAMTAGADIQKRVDFRRYGITLGLAFQALDDWLGIWGDAAATGKSVESDLATGKKTLPVVYALEQGGPFKEHWLRGPVRVEDIPLVIDLLSAAGAEEFTLQKAAELTSEAREALMQAVPDAEKAGFLVELTDSLLKRNK
jgi:geranylgeranyl diphosphate synthase type I